MACCQTDPEQRVDAAFPEGFAHRQLADLDVGDRGGRGYRGRNLPGERRWVERADEMLKVIDGVARRG